MGKLYLGTREVTPLKEFRAFNVDGYDWLGEINSQGTLVSPTKDLNIVFTGVKDLSGSIFYNFFSSDSRLKSISFPDLESISGNSACLRGFRYSALASVSFPKLESISGNSVFQMAFNGVKIETFSLPELLTITGTGVFSSAFSGNSYFKKISFPKLTSAASNSFYQVAQNSAIEEASFPLLTTIGDGGFSLAFASTPLETLNLNSLTTAGSNVFDSAFYGTNIRILSFPSLTTVGSKCFTEMVSGYNFSPLITDIYFNSLNSNSFGGNTDCFNNMLDEAPNVTVHFPVGLDATIGNWSDVLAGFGGVNTTILYDL